MLGARPFFVCVLVCGTHGHVNEQSFYFKHLWEQMMSVIFMALFCFFLCLSKFKLGEFDFREQPASLEAREKGRILMEA
jgi:hypothetical protein